MAVPAFASTGTYYAPGGTGTSHVVPAPASVGSLDIVLVHIYIESNTAVTAPGTFLEVPTAPFTSGPTTGQRVFWARGPGGSTYTFTTGSAVFREAVASRWTGCITTGTPYDVGGGAPSSAQRSSNATTTPAVSLTTQGPERRLVWSAGAVAVSNPWTPPSGFTEHVDQAELTLASEDQVAAGATGSITGTANAASFQTAFLLALIPPPSFIPPFRSQYTGRY